MEGRPWTDMAIWLEAEVEAVKRYESSWSKPTEKLKTPVLKDCQKVASEKADV